MLRYKKSVEEIVSSNSSRTERLKMVEQNKRLNLETFLLKKSIKDSVTFDIASKQSKHRSGHPSKAIPNPGNKKSRVDDILEDVHSKSYDMGKGRSKVRELERQIELNQNQVARNIQFKNKIENMHFRIHMKDLRERSEELWRHCSSIGGTKLS